MTRGEVRRRHDDQRHLLWLAAHDHLLDGTYESRVALFERHRDGATCEACPTSYGPRRPNARREAPRRSGNVLLV